MAKKSILDFQSMVSKGEKITYLTAYDYLTAKMQEKAGVDMILVGDSLGMVSLGYDTTFPVTMNDMIRHCQAVRRGAPNTFVIGDMPYMSYQISDESAIANAGRFIQEAGADCVKLEGGGPRILKRIQAINEAGILCMGHIGLTPQTATSLGGFKVQGKSAQAAKQLLDDAKALEDAGCFSIVLEAIPAPLAERITQAISIPTIGIGAGPNCDGQVLVIHDLVGLYDRFTPKFVKQYAKINEPILAALRQYKAEVENRSFPTEAHSFTMKSEELDKLLQLY